MKLNKRQKAHFLEGLAEGLETDELNKRAEKFKPPYSVLRSQVTYYRKTRDIKLDELKKHSENDALKTGFALKENRVAVLQRLADKFASELLDGDKLWLPMSKGIGNGPDYERIDYEEFNKAEVDALRDVLDDIAGEVGERVKKSDITTGGKPIEQPSAHYEILKGSVSDDELEALERAASIIDKAKRDSDAAKPG